MAAPRVACGQPLDGQPGALEGTPLFEALDGIARTGGLMPAIASEEWRNHRLIEANESYEQVFQEFHIRKIMIFPWLCAGKM